MCQHKVQLLDSAFSKAWRKGSKSWRDLGVVINWLHLESRKGIWFQFWSRCIYLGRLPHVLEVFQKGINFCVYLLWISNNAMGKKKDKGKIIAVFLLPWVWKMMMHLPCWWWVERARNEMATIVLLFCHHLLSSGAESSGGSPISI